VRKQQVMDRSRAGEERDRASSRIARAPARSTRICSSISTKRSRNIGGFRARAIAKPSFFETGEHAVNGEPDDRSYTHHSGSSSFFKLRDVPDARDDYLTCLVAIPDLCPSSHSLGSDGVSAVYPEDVDADVDVAANVERNVEHESLPLHP
jgi:hypothetical protein